jgi:phosphomannomutase
MGVTHMPVHPRITFGTDGWRAEMAREFTFDNVALVAQAVANRLNDAGKGGRGVFVGYDARFLSDRFAACVADVLGANGVPALLPPRDCPTPVAAFAAGARGLAGAVMVTASHNPPEQNGVKFLPDYLSPALPDVTDDITARIAAIQAGRGAARTGGPAPETFDPWPAYVAHLGSVLNLRALAGLTVCVDPLFGSGRGFLPDLLRGNGCAVHTLHDTRDPLFGGGLPEPNAERLAELSAVVRATGADLGLALDGDADRFGIVDGRGAYVPANEVICLALLHWRRTRFPSGPAVVVRSVTTSGRVDALARHLGVSVIETPVGFKWVGEKLRTVPEAILGGEESGGLSARGHLPEKDGLFADLLITEMVATTGTPLHELRAEVRAVTGDFYRSRLDVRLPDDEQRALIARLAADPPSELAGAPVAAVSLLDGVKLTRADGSWLLVRAGGTEPVLRAFVEARNPDTLETLRSVVRGLLGLTGVE